MTREEDVSKVLCDGGMRIIHCDLQPTYEVSAIVSYMSEVERVKEKEMFQMWKVTAGKEPSLCRNTQTWSPHSMSRGDNDDLSRNCFKSGE